MLVALVRADHAHLSDVVVLVRPLQKRVLESQSRHTLEERGGERYDLKKSHRPRSGSGNPGNRTCRPWTEEKSVRGREREAAGLSLPSFRPDVPHQWVEAVLHISSSRSMVLSLQGQGEGTLLPLRPHHGVTAGPAVVPAVGDLTDDVEGFLQVDGVRNHLQRQPDVSVSRRLGCLRRRGKSTGGRMNGSFLLMGQTILCS